jgi:transposase
MTQRNKPRNAAVFGIDLGKNVFHVVGLDATGVPIQRATFRRETLLQFFERATRSLVGMEACPGSQWLARKLTALGHTVRIVPAKFVKPYVKSNKSDIIDAEAIAEAVSRPTMRFVEIRSPDQVDLQALHRVRDRLVAQRARVICQMRASASSTASRCTRAPASSKPICLECWLMNRMTLVRRCGRLLAVLFDDVKGLETRIREVTKEIEVVAAADDTARRLMTILWIGPLAATALLAAAGRGLQSGRHATWQPGLDLCLASTRPAARRHYSALVREEFVPATPPVHGARSCLLHLDRSRDRLGTWIDALQRRMHNNKVTVALAAKMARVAWVVITKPGATYERRGPAVA